MKRFENFLNESKQLESGEEYKLKLFGEKFVRVKYNGFKNNKHEFEVVSNGWDNMKINIPKEKENEIVIK